MVTLLRVNSFIIVSALLFAALTPTATAQTTDPNPATSEWIEASLVVQQPDILTLDVSGTILIRKFEIQGTSYETSDDIADAYQQMKQADEFARQRGQESARAEAFVHDIEDNATRVLRETLERNFPGATVTVERASIDLDTLRPPAGNAYEPGVLLYVSAQVARTPEDVGLDGLSTDAVNAVFNAGAVVSAKFPLSASAGHHVTYIISPPEAPEGLAFDGATPADVAQVYGDSLMVEIDNSRATTERLEDVVVELYQPSAVENRPDAERIVAQIEISLGALEEGATAIPVDAVVAANIHAIDVAARFPDALPSTVDLPFLSSEALSALYAAGAIKDADLTQASDELKGTLVENLDAVMDDVVVTEPGFDTDAMADGAAAPYGTDTPVVFSAVAQGVNPLPEGGENADLALLLGATLDVDLDLQASKDQDTIVVVRAPEGSVFAAAEGGEVSEDGKTATFQVAADPAEAARAVKLALRGADAPTYTEEDAASGSRFSAILDLQKVDISLTEAAGGDFGMLVGEVNVRVEMGVFEIPDEFKSGLPEGLNLEYLDSNAVRLLAERGLVTDQQLADLENAFIENVTTNLRNALQVQIAVTGGLAKGTLDASGVTGAGAENPIVLAAKATFAKPLAGGAAPPPATAALSLYSMPQSFKLPSVQGLPTTYKVILPRGLAADDVQVQGGTSETGTENGRSYFIVNPEDGGEATATMSIAVTPTFVAVNFWYVLVIALVIIGLPIAVPLVIRARRKKAAQK